MITLTCSLSELLSYDFVSVFAHYVLIEDDFEQPIISLVFFTWISAAVKFGHGISFGRCISLMDDLAMCQAPFQCAHGRPSLAPILDCELVLKLIRENQPARSGQNGKVIKRNCYNFSMAKLRAALANSQDGNSDSNGE